MTRLKKIFTRYQGTRRTPDGCLSTRERREHLERSLAAAADGGEGGSRRKDWAPAS